MLRWQRGTGTDIEATLPEDRNIYHSYGTVPTVRYDVPGTRVEEERNRCTVL